MSNMSLPDRLRWIIEHRGFGNAKALSVAADLSPNHVGMIIRGDVKGRPAGETMAKIARAAGVPVGWLLTGEGSPDEGTPPRPPPPEPTVEREAARPEIDAALMAALDKSRHTLRDVAAVSYILAKSWGTWGEPIPWGAELPDVAGRMLDAAAELRRAGRTVTAELLASMLARAPSPALSEPRIERPDLMPARTAAVEYYRRSANADMRAAAEMVASSDYHGAGGWTVEHWTAEIQREAERIRLDREQPERVATRKAVNAKKVDEHIAEQERRKKRSRAKREGG